MSFCVSNKSFLASTSIASVFLALTTIHSIAAPAACPSPIPLGLTTALTGNLALLGTQARNGVEFAVDEINKNGGIARQTTCSLPQRTPARPARTR